jgi:4-aminobutyrate aminotransferase-like enzyme
MLALEQEEIVQKDKKYVIHGWGYSPITLVEGHGSVVKDINGKEYIDCLSQTAGVLGVGHTHPKYLSAVKSQLDKISHTLTMFVNPPRAELGEKLAKIAPGKMRNNIKTYFSTGGSEANEVALKFAMLATKKKEVVSVWHAYHGGTLALMSAMGQSWHRQSFVRFPGFSQIPNAYSYRCPFGKKHDPETCDIEAAQFLEEHIKYGTANDVAAFIIEPIQGNGGHTYPMNPEYFKIIREICNRYDILLVIDEVQTGMGRTGKIWASDYFGIEPDIMTSAKALGGGMPISATMIRSDLVPESLLESQWHIFTMGGGPVECAAANAAIDIMLEEKLPEQAARQGERVTKTLNDGFSRHPMVGEVRGPGLFVGVELVKNRRTKEPATDEAVKVFSKCLEKGVLFGLSAKAGYGNVIKIKPPLSIPDELMDKSLEILDGVLTEVEREEGIGRR